MCQQGRWNREHVPEKLPIAPEESCGVAFSSSPSLTSEANLCCWHGYRPDVIIDRLTLSLQISTLWLLPCQGRRGKTKSPGRARHP
jgi:hypothetical protein